ncbi:unnamed protein product, partial [Brachionus calyciflorus]
KNKYQGLFANEISKPEIYWDKYLIIICRSIFKISVDDPVIKNYLKSNFSKDQYLKLKNIINTLIGDNSDIDKIYCLIKSLNEDGNLINYKDIEPNSLDAEKAFQVIISAQNFEVENMFFEFIKKFIEKNLGSKNLSKRDLCEIDYTLAAHMVFNDIECSRFNQFKLKHRKRLVLYFLVIKFGWSTGYNLYKNLNKK